jgi:hypothetical protein
MRDLFLQAAGVLGIAAALVHGYLGETSYLRARASQPVGCGCFYAAFCTAASSIGRSWARC